MRKKAIVMLASAAGATLGMASMTSVAHAQFVDNFNNGNVFNSDTITNFWSTGTYNSGDGSTISEAVGGPLTMAYPKPGVTQGGPFMYSAPVASLNFMANPLTVTLTAAPGGNLLPGTDESQSNGAQTYLGIDGNGGFRPDNGSNRIIVQISDQNVPEIVIKNNANSTDYNYSIFNPAGQTFIPQGTNISNIDVTSMFLYVDGTQEGSDHLFINFGETWVNTTTGVPGSYSFENRLGITSPFDIGTGTGTGGLNTTDQSQATLDTVKNGYASGVGLGIEVLNVAGNLNGNESVAIGQISAVVPEPTSLGLAAVSLGLMLRRRNRRA